jgi:hypothetical protein
VIAVGAGQSIIFQTSAGSALTVGPASVKALVPIHGDSTPYGLHGRTSIAVGATNVTLSAAQYSRRMVDLTAGGGVGARTITWPHPASEDACYTAIIGNTSGFSQTISTGTGSTYSSANGTVREVRFTPSGVSAAYI